MVIYADERRKWLASVQNPDGGWGYYPARASWLEPTAWAALALSSSGEHSGRVRKALGLLRSWQRPDGACRPHACVDEPAWATSLWVTLHLACGITDPALDRAVSWLIGTRGAEGSLWRRTLARILSGGSTPDGGSYGWAWVAGTNSWVEPTAHARLALRRYLAVCGGRTSHRHEIEFRVEAARRMLLDRRCHDGGWNYGAREALGVPLESFPETTAIALVGLQNEPNAAPTVDRARQWHRAGIAPLGAAWLRVALQVHGISGGPVPAKPSDDVLLTALDCLGSDGSACQVLSVRGAA